MPLEEPPTPAELSRLPRIPLRGRVLHRVFRASRSSPWWFSSRSPQPHPADGSGRFDLPPPLGACYLSRTPVGAVLEAFQHLGPALLPDVELYQRRRAEVTAPERAPDAADVASPRARGLGVTAALWAGGDRARTQQWALAILRAGWRAIHHGIQHDPEGRLRAVTLFDGAGEHAPFGDSDGWRATIHTLHDDVALRAALARYGITVMPTDVQLGVVPLDELGLS